MKKFSYVFVLFAVCMFCFSGVVNAEDKIQLFTNGTIYINAEQKAQNLLVKDGVVQAWNVDPAKYKNAEVIDLEGGVAYPGFIDSHVHLLETGYFFYAGANLIDCKNADDIAKVLAQKVKSVSDGGFVIGVGFSLRDYDKWSLADLAKIDAVSGSHPVFLGDKLGHNAIINTAAIKLVGITLNTPVPLGGKMGVENGKLTGMLRESAMIIPTKKMFAMFDSKDIKTGTQELAQRWASLGYTGVVDLMGGPGVRFMRPEIFKELEKEGKLPLRVNYCYTIFNLSDVDDAAKYLNQDTDLVRFVGCKIFVDGAYAGGQAWTSWKNKQGNHGLQEIYTDDAGGHELNLNRIVAKVEEYGMNMHYHVQGDKAIDAVLDALDKVIAEKGKLKGIHTLIHLAFPADGQIARIKKFNGHVVTTVQPGFWPVESDTAYYYGERASRAYPIKKLIDAGLSVGLSTDFSVSPPDYSPSLVVIGVATTGGGDPKVHPPISVKDAIKGFTVGSAKTTGKNDIGTLEVGKKADMSVFDRDLYTVAPKEFSANYPKVLSTWVGGRKVYELRK